MRVNIVYYPSSIVLPNRPRYSMIYIWRWRSQYFATPVAGLHAELHSKAFSIRLKKENNLESEKKRNAEKRRVKSGLFEEDTLYKLWTCVLNTTSRLTIPEPLHVFLYAYIRQSWLIRICTRRRQAICTGNAHVSVNAYTGLVSDTVSYLWVLSCKYREWKKKA